MVDAVYRIGLSLGADICWPICYESLLKQLDLKIPLDGDTLRFESERIHIEPFRLTQECRYDVVIDRLTHWYHTSREWIKKAILLNDLYVFNNPWSLQSMEKQTTYCAMMRLGFPVPETWLIPPKAYQQTADLAPTLKQYAKLFDLGDIGDQLGYPMFLKPYDGGGWVGVNRIDDRKALLKAYDSSGMRVMHLQKAILPSDGFARCIGLGPQVRFVNYHPSEPLHDRYGMDTEFLSEEEMSLLRDTTLTINAFFGWDFNSCEALRREGVWHPIDFANACPDSQVTSLHFHFPWLILANLRWSVFCAATRRKMKLDMNWQSYFDIADSEMPFEEKLAGYVGLAHERFETERFEEFCATHLAHLDEVALEFFASTVVHDAVRCKVESLYPHDEVDSFTELFWNRIQRWRESVGART